MAQKRSSESLHVSSVTQSSPNATASGVLTSLSPMKKSKKASFFEGAISDGSASMRLFDSGMRRRLANFEESREPVTIGNCEVKPSRVNNDLELLVKSRSEVERSDKTYHVISTVDALMGKETSLGNILDLPPYDRVTVRVKVFNVDDIVEVAGGKNKQDIDVRDATGIMKFTVWEKDIGKLQKGRSYKLGGVVVREYNANKYLSTSLDTSIIEEIPDIGDFADDYHLAESPISVLDQLDDTQVIGVIYLEHQLKCLNCGYKVSASDDPQIGQCTKCHMIQCIDACDKSLSTRVMVKGSHTTPITLLAFGDIINQIANTPDEVTVCSLLKAPSFSAFYKDGIIRSITR